MLKEVLFMGAREAEQIEPSQTTVIISILDQFEEHNRPTRLRKFRDHLMLSFVDRFEEPGQPHWPDQMTDAEHRAACTWEDDRTSAARLPILRTTRIFSSCVALGVTFPPSPFVNRVVRGTYSSIAQCPFAGRRRGVS